MGYEPPFQNSARIVSRVADIAELVGQVTILDGLYPNSTLRREDQIRTIHSSLLIENNALTLDQVTAVLGGRHVLAPPKDIREVQNAYEAYDVAAAFDPYSLDDLLKAHKLMMDGLVRHPGCLRSENVGVYAGDVLIHPGTPSNYVPQVMADLFDWLSSSEDHPLVKGSVFHCEFEFIHPFMDGNGSMNDAQPFASDERAMASDERAMASDRTALILSCVDAEGSITTTRVAELLNLSKQRTRAILQNMVDDGLLEKHGNGRYTYCTLLSEA